MLQLLIKRFDSMKERTVYIIDLIGCYSGLDYYDVIFAKELSDGGLNVRILSNFNKDGNRPFLKMIFGRNAIIGITNLIYNFFKLLFFILRHKKDAYIFLSFGVVSDFIFFVLSLFSRNFFIDIHELYAAEFINNKMVKSIFNFYYRKVINKTIYHSEKTLTTLNQIQYAGLKLYVPHFKYNFNPNYNERNIGKDILCLYKSPKKKLLFFGNLRQVKGVDIVIDCFLQKDYSQEVELVFAGKNVENIDFRKIKEYYDVVDRHINDDEMKYLYCHTDFVLLPYRDSSQSGVLEMAFFYRKPMLFSNIQYFRDVLSKYPSFGFMESIKDFNNLIEKVVKDSNKWSFYQSDDCERYLMRQEIEGFIQSFVKHLN